LGNQSQELTFIFDSSAIIAFLWEEEGANIVESLIMNPQNTCIIHAINLCEVYYDIIRRSDELNAQNIITRLASVMIIREDMNNEFWQQAGNLRHISLADCFCMAISQKLGGTIVTTDHHEFDAIVKQGIVIAKFIR
jgi:PIN domain nuclease of toxin-antitoxin system